MYVGYLMLRAFAEEPQAGARYGAVLAILGLPAMILNHFAVQWWRTLHQPSSLLRPGGPSVAPVILWPLVFNIVAMLVAYSYFLLERVRLERIRHRTAEVRLKRGRRG
jgi:heme exporter protein C